jgi:hypothetical protein
MPILLHPFTELHIGLSVVFGRETGWEVEQHRELAELHESLGVILP